MNYRVCIVEDDEQASDKLSSFIREYGKKHEDCEFTITCFKDVLSFLDEFSGNFDFIFMDIELPILNGMETVRRIREKDETVIVIFVTNMAQYAVKGYEVNALDFIVKPVQYESFSMKMDRAIGRFDSTRGQELWIGAGSNRRRLRVSQIKYIEVAHHCVMYHTTEGDYSAYDQLYNVQAALADAPFALCNRCFLVNLAYVTAVEEYSVVVAGETLQISRSKKKSFLLRLNEFLGGK